MLTVSSGKGWVAATLPAPTLAPPPVIPAVPDKPPKHYVVVRTDMPLHVQMVQCCHAALQAGAKFGVPAYAHLSLLAVPDRAALEDVSERLAYRGIQLTTFWEPDDDLGWTALCTGAVDGPPPPCLRRLPLWKHP